MQWLRNAWGSVDQSGRHTYDVMQRDQYVISPYDKLHQTTERDVAESKQQFVRHIGKTCSSFVAFQMSGRIDDWRYLTFPVMKKKISKLANL